MAANDLPSLVLDNIACLQDGLELLERLPEAIYALPQRAGGGGSIGEHLRHNLDHYVCFLRGIEPGLIDYDARERELRTAADPDHAAAIVRDLIEQLEAVGPFIDPAAPVSLHMRCGNSDETVPSSLGRELQFLVSHTIHHYALIAIFCRQEGIELPAHFGVAPSTLEYRAQSSGGN